jgi:glucose-6-phosphate isomerase
MEGALVRLVGADGPHVDALLERLAAEDVLGQLVERRGLAAQLATEDGDVKLDWVDGVAWALDHGEAIEALERQVAEVLGRGVRHLVWAGMGGSVQTVHVLRRLGLLDRAAAVVHTLDSTDPAALNRLVRRLCQAGENDPLGDRLPAAFRQTLMVGVSMGMTSEEPITHLEWFEGLLRDAGIRDTAGHLLVMTIPDSFLDRFARERGVERLSIQPNGDSHTPGRMSAPSTHVFLLPAALAMAQEASGASLRTMLEHRQSEYGLRGSLSAEERANLVRQDPFARLAVWLAAQVEQGRNKLLLVLPPAYRGLAPWIEQVIEESLGKGGKGLLVFHDQDLSSAGTWPDTYCVLEFVETGGGTPEDLLPRPLKDHPVSRMCVPRLGPNDTVNRLALMARLFAGWNLLVALFGYLQKIVFAGQPAVEGYKRYARQLRQVPGELPYPERQIARASANSEHEVSLYYGALPAAGLEEEQLAAWCRARGTSIECSPAAVLAAACALLAERGRLGYFDVTLNADPGGSAWDAVRASALRLANTVLRRPAKVRSGPRDYHSTEQSETDGPNEVLSLRVLVLRPEPSLAGEYSYRFLHAQALGTMMAMRDAGRPVLLAMVERPDDVVAVAGLLDEAGRLLAGTQSPTGA